MRNFPNPTETTFLRELADLLERLAQLPPSPDWERRVRQSCYQAASSLQYRYDLRTEAEKELVSR